MTDSSDLTEDNEKFRFSWDDFPALTQTPGTGGVIRQELADFVVKELALYEPQGSGSHAYALVEKQGLTTRDLVLILMREGLKENEIGVAGLKDKYAITTQWLSVPNRHAELLDKLDDHEGVRVLERSRHKNKLGIGHLAGNHFEIRVRQTSAVASQLASDSLEQLVHHGVPNYFGPQRFGRFANNAVDGLKLIRGEHVPGGRRLKAFFISSVQSLLFNHMLAARIKEGLFQKVVLGDWAKKHDTGGVFKVEDETESARAERFDISATLPLYGKKVKVSDAIAGEREQASLDYYGLRWIDFSSRRGDRRYSRIKIQNASIRPEEDGYTVIFDLPRGSFATNVLRELTKTPVDELSEAEVDT
ncbi:MAG: tRNA pseudouridine(13) synthase TruD [Trueperaceae bacterium]|nr:tRNA pseudouridine(13) synthase TruD [Trueperaceae bacterium]